MRHREAKLKMCEPCKRGRHDMCLKKVDKVDCICNLMGHQK